MRWASLTKVNTQSRYGKMKLNITKSKKNELLKRTEITAEISFDTATPQRAEVKKAIAASAKCKEDLLVVKKINSHYGGKTADVTAYAYSDKDLFEKVEREYMRTRNAKPVKEEPKEEAPAEAAPEAPAPEGDAPATEEKSEEAAEPAKEEAPKEKPEEKPAEEAKEEKPEEKAEEKPAEAPKEEPKKEDA